MLSLNFRRIQQFKRSRPKAALEFRPLLSHETDFKEKLSIRGQKFVDLRGMHHLEYDGFIIMPQAQHPPSPGFESWDYGAESSSLHFQVSS